MTEQINQVTEFHEAYGQPVFPEEGISGGRLRFRMMIIKEEFRELVEADKSGDIQAIAKEACDLAYVLFGTHIEGGGEINEEALSFGHTLFLDTNYDLSDVYNEIEVYKEHPEVGLSGIMHDLLAYISKKHLGTIILRCFNEVHRSNMSKLGKDGKPILREDGKVLKGPNYSPADLSFLNFVPRKISERMYKVKSHVIDLNKVSYLDTKGFLSIDGETIYIGEKHAKEIENYFIMGDNNTLDFIQR